MTSLERVLTALNREEPDRPPICEMFVSPSFIRKNKQKMTYMNFIDEIGFDVVTIPSVHKYSRLKENIYKDSWGVVYHDTGEWQMTEIENPIKTKDDLLSLNVPDYREDYRFAELEEAVQRFKGKKAIIFFVRDAFSRPRKLMGMTNLLSGYLIDPELVHDITEISVEYNSKLARLAIEKGADIIMSADDYGTTESTLMSPDIFKQFIFPGLKKIVTTVHEYGKKYIKHSDGNLTNLMEMIINTGIDGLHPIDPAAGLDIREMKKTIGDRICLIGNIDCINLLPNGSPQEVKDEVEGLIRDVAPGGGFMIASSNSIHSGVKYENLVAMIETARNYGR